MENSIKFKDEIGNQEYNIFCMFMNQTLRGEMDSNIYFLVARNAFGIFRYISLGGDIYRVNGREYMGVAFDYFEEKMYLINEDFDVVATLEYRTR